LIVDQAEMARPRARWMGHRLLAVDGSSLRFAESAEFLEAERYPRHLFRDLHARRWGVEESLKQL
jgi:hypothetical protein